MKGTVIQFWPILNILLILFAVVGLWTLAMFLQWIITAEGCP